MKVPDLFGAVQPLLGRIGYMDWDQWRTTASKCLQHVPLLIQCHKLKRLGEGRGRLAPEQGLLWAARYHLIALKEDPEQVIEDRPDAQVAACRAHRRGELSQFWKGRWC